MLRQALEVERRLRQHRVHGLSLDHIEDRVREARVRPGRHEVERVAQVSSHRPLGHVRTDQADVPFAVVAEGMQKPCGARRARRRDEDGDRPHAISILSAPKLVDSPGVLGLQQRAHRLRHRRSLVDPDLGVGQQLEPGERTGVQLVVRAPVAPVLVRVRAIGPGAKYGGAITLTAPSTGAVMYSGSGLCHANTASNRSSSAAWVDRMEPDAVRSRRRGAGAFGRGKVVEDGLGHQEVRRPHARLGLELAELQGCVEREIDVVAEGRPRGSSSKNEVVAAGSGSREQLAVVRQVERARHAASISTSSSRGPSRVQAPRCRVGRRDP